MRHNRGISSSNYLNDTTIITYTGQLGIVDGCNYLPVIPCFSVIFDQQ